MTNRIDLMIIGAQKAGTSSLHQYLAQHPRICTHSQREITYFIDDNEYQQNYLNVYKRYFGSYNMNHTAIMGKNVGVMYLPRAIERLRIHNPAMQLVVFLRHPVRRAYSAYWYARRTGWENIDYFDDAIQAAPGRFGSEWIRERSCAYLERSRHIEHLRVVLSYFPREQAYIFLVEDLKENVRKVCRQIFESVELESDFPIDIQRNYNTAAIVRYPIVARFLSTRSIFNKAFRMFLPNRAADRTKATARHLNEKEFTPPPISPKMFNQLIDYFKPYNQELGALLGRDLAHWDFPL